MEGWFSFYFAFMEITHEKACLCALNRIFGFEPKISQALISHLGSGTDIFSLNQEELDLLLGPHSKYRDCISARALENSYDELERLKSRGFDFIGCNELEFPSALKECEDCPTGLYIRGSSPESLWNTRRMISFVGTRDLSPYGKEWCEKLIGSLADVLEKDRPVIISGLALGTDICAHERALSCGLPTIAVMATGIEEVYPARHRFQADRISKTPGSALITDYPPGTAPLAIHFLRRNRIIAGMSEATVLIESKIKGGGMMTARLADSYNRSVFALPGRVDDLRSQGCNNLIHSRTAIPITSVTDFLKELGMKRVRKNPMKDDTENLISIYRGSLSEDNIALMGKILLAIRKERGVTVEEVSASTDIDYNRANQLIGMLETDGLITRDLLQRCFINFSR